VDSLSAQERAMFEVIALIATLKPSPDKAAQIVEAAVAMAANAYGCPAALSQGIAERMGRLLQEELQIVAPGAVVGAGIRLGTRLAAENPAMHGDFVEAANRG
jgi:hypothetical protein